jgi:hypothetical protein
MFLVA